MPLTVQATVLPQALEAPGGVALVPVETHHGTAPEVTFDGARVAVVEDADESIAVVGIPLTTEPGERWLDIAWSGDERARQSFTVAPKNYETQYLTIEDDRQVNPLPEDLERIYREQAITEKTLSTWRNITPEFEFIRPVDGPISSTYGLRRILNNEPRSPHSGLDIAAAKDTPIRAPADATVLYTGDFFFNGKVVYLDHGQGLITMYCHMDQIDVEQGQSVHQNDVIGQVGATGRATGPHLHWGVYLNATPVDPNLFVASQPQP